MHVCRNSLVVLQQVEARGKKQSEQMNDEWLAIRLDRLNSIVHAVITVLLNTSLTAESTCLALLSGSALFELFIHLGLFSFLSTIRIYCACKCIYIYIYKPHLLFNDYFFLFFPEHSGIYVQVLRLL